MLFFCFFQLYINRGRCNWTTRKVNKQLLQFLFRLALIAFVIDNGKFSVYSPKNLLHFVGILLLIRHKFENKFVEVFGIRLFALYLRINHKISGMKQKQPPYNVL